MNRKNTSLCNRFLSNLNLAVAALSLGAVGLLTGTAHAETTPASINIESANINWTQLPSQLMGELTTPIVVGIGIALSIWAIFAAVKFFRRSAA